ncbi:MAG: DUF2087 domain-containing protein [Pseudomonadota bacterium]
MPRDEIPLVLTDVSQFARALRGGWPEAATHQSVLNAVARAAGFRNFQHLKAVQTGPEAEAPPKMAQVRKAAAWFDGQGRFTGWPVKRSLRMLCLWPIWARLPKGRVWSEQEVSALIHAECTFRDAAGIRREMVGEGMMVRTRDGAEYRRVEMRPDATQLAMIRMVGARGP